MFWTLDSVTFRTSRLGTMWSVCIWAFTSFRQVGEESSGTLATMLPASEATVGASVEEFEAEGKVVGAGEVVGEVQFLVSFSFSAGLTPRIYRHWPWWCYCLFLLKEFTSFNPLCLHNMTFSCQFVKIAAKLWFLPYFLGKKKQLSTKRCHDL